MKLDNFKFYTYVYYDPQTMQPFLVGKGSDKRAYFHLSEEFHETKNFHKWAKIESLKKQNLQPIIKLFQFETEVEAYNLESFLTHFWGIESEGGILTNIIHGGLGGWKGVKKSEEHKRKIGESNKLASLNPKTFQRKSKALKGNKNALGSKHSPRTKEHCEKLSNAAKERLSNPENHPLFGKHHSDETKEKMSLKKLGKKMSECMKEKISKLHKGTKRTQETKDKMSNSAANRFNFRWQITHPNGNKEIISSLSNFCKQNNLSAGNFCIYGHTKGYKAQKVTT